MLPLKISLTVLSLTVANSMAFAQNKSLRDPTLPGVVMQSSGAMVTGSAPSRLVLQSIVRSGNVSSVVINNQVYSLGDSVRGSRIKHIGVDEITFSNGSKLSLFEAVTESVGK